MSMVFSINAAFAETNKGPNVVVIGAGLAGLTAAYRLQNQGMEVHLYEAKNRVGGRVFTVNINGHAAELGAQNITDGGQAANLNGLINEFSLEVHQYRVNFNQSYCNGENLVPVGQLLRNKQFDAELLRGQLTQLASTSRNMKEVLEGIIEPNDPLYRVLAVRLAAYEGASIEKLSTLYTETLYQMLLGGISSVYQGNGEEENFLDLASIKGGNAALPKKIAEALGSRLHLNRALTKVSKTGDGSFTLTFQDSHEVKADVLILAIPCSVYEQIIFTENVIPFDRLQDIQNVQYGTNAKILVPFSHAPETRVGLVNDQTVCFFDADRSILTVYCTEEASRFSNETILNSYIQIRPMIEMGFGQAAPLFAAPIYVEDQVFTAYDAPVGYSWPNDPYTKGSYSYISAGQETLLTATTEERGEKFKTLFAPIDQNLYFAGEHTSILMDVSGTMEAACESGERVARAILNQFFAPTFQR